MYKKIRAIIFDFGKVLAKFDHMKICEELTGFSPLKAQEIYRIIFTEGLEKEYDCGRINSIDFYELVSKRICAFATLCFRDFAKIWGDNFTPNSEIDNIIACIRPDIRKILLSNTNELHWENIRKVSVVERFFSNPDFLIRSYKEGMRKPEIEIFHLAIKKAGCPSEEIVYIDDVAEYINIFIGLGGNGVLYDCTKDSVIYLLKKLNPFGVFI